jgi:hypothetical protein
MRRASNYLIAGAVVAAICAWFIAPTAAGDKSQNAFNVFTATNNGIAAPAGQVDLVGELSGRPVLLAAADPSAAESSSSAQKPGGQKPGGKTSSGAATQNKDADDAPTAVPEPSGFSLFAFGLLFLYFLMRQRRGTIRI